MKTHKVKYGGEFTINGYDDCFRTFCGINENHSEDMIDMFVGINDKCTCKVCNKAYESYTRAEIILINKLGKI